jgi:DNA primase
LRGIQLARGRSFHCFNPEHEDKTASCGIFEGDSGTPLFHCFGCGAAGSIFEACHLLEGKPLSGHGFLMDTLPYLAQTWNIELPDLGALADDPDAVYEMETYQAYAHAAMIIRNSEKSKRVEAKLLEYGWPVEVLSAIGIGSVKSYEDYLHRMTHQYGHSARFLQEVDLDRRGIFHENNLIYTIKDEHGAPVGFTARDLLFEEKDAEYQKKRAALEQQLAADPKKLKEEVAKLYRPRKYNNSAESGEVELENGARETRPKNRIFKKGSRLFNFDLARKAVPPLYIFEGQSDATTAFAAGLRNSTCVGSTAFTKDHLDLLLRNDPPIKHVIFVFDADKAGQKGMQRAVKMIEEVFAGNVGLQVDLVIMPEGSDDPDRFIRSFGIKAFRNLERMDLFSWRMKEAVEKGEDPVEVADRAVGLILNQPNILRRRQMAKRLATVTGQPEDIVWAEVERRIDVDRSLIEEQKSTITARMLNEIKRHPEQASQRIAEACVQMEMVDKQKHGYDLRSAVDALDLAYDRADKNDSRVGLYTGWEIFDDKLRGLPRFEKFISVPGKPNHAKSTIFDNLAWRVAEHKANKDVIVVFHTADDSLYERHSRILGSKFNIPSVFFEAPAAFLGNPEACAQYGCPNFEEILPKARAWLRGLFEAERLLVLDINEVAPSFPALGRYVTDIRKRYPDKHILVLEDNFHLLEMPGYEPGEAKIAASSHFMKGLCTRQQVTVMATMEIPKTNLDPGKRPFFTNLKGSAAIPYDINANYGIYTDMADLGDDSQLRWEDHEHQEDDVTATGEHIKCNRMQPVVELLSDKNKISGWKGTLFFKLWPDSGAMEECSKEDQANYRQILETPSE